MVAVYKINIKNASNSQNLNKMPYKIASNIGNRNKSDRKCRLIE